MKQSINDQNKQDHVKNLFSLRQKLQLIVFFLTIAIGIQFSIFIYQTTQSPDPRVIRPPGIEAFLPIGGLTSWKLFFTTGNWDDIHPAAPVMLGFAVMLSLIMRKAFCGWFCPAGALSEWLWQLGKHIGLKIYKLPKIVDIPLRTLKYLLLGFFIWAILIKMSPPMIEGFLKSPYYMMADAKMLFFFLHPSLLTISVLAILTILSLIIKQFWCRYLCPYGALLGLFSIISPARVERNVDLCIDCKMCSTKCFYNLPVSEKKRIIDAECVGCLECVRVCPERDALELKFFGLKLRRPTVKVCLITVVFFAVCWYTAQLTGHWHSKLTSADYHYLLRMIDNAVMKHPSF